MSLNVVVDENGKTRSKEDIDFADSVIKLKNTKDHWAVIEKLIGRWVTSESDEAEALKIQIEDYKEMLDDKEFASTKGGKDMDRRFSLIFPIRLMLMIRAIYSEEELQFDRKFYKDFVKKYPNFAIAEKQ